MWRYHYKRAHPSVHCDKKEPSDIRLQEHEPAFMTVKRQSDHNTMREDELIDTGYTVVKLAKKTTCFQPHNLSHTGFVYDKSMLSVLRILTHDHTMYI